MIGRALILALLVPACGKLCFGDAAPIDAPFVDAVDAPLACGTPVLGCASVVCGGRCFEVCTATSTWMESQNLCALRKQCLAQVDSPAIASCLGGAITGSTWVGLVQSPAATTPGGAWLWSCTIAPATPVWASMEPNDLNPTPTEDHEEECGYVRGPNADAVDASCDARVSYLCEAR